MQAVSRETAAKVNCVQRKMKKDEKKFLTKYRARDILSKLTASAVSTLYLVN